MRKVHGVTAVAVVLAATALAAVAWAATPEQAAMGNTDPAAWANTETSLGVALPVSGDSNGNATADYRIRLAGGSYPDTWHELAITGGTARGTAAGLTVATGYELELRLTDPDGIATAPPAATVSGNQAVLEVSARTPRNTTHAAASEATAAIQGTTNNLAMRWPASGDENTSAVATYYLRPTGTAEYAAAGELAWFGHSSEATATSSLEGTATRLLPGTQYEAYLTLADADGTNGSPEATTVVTPVFTFTVPTEPVLLDAPDIAPKPTGATVWLPYSSDSDDNATADLLLSADGGQSWSRHAMTRDTGARRFASILTGLAPDTHYAVAFDVQDPDGTAGTGPTDTFTFKTLAPWAVQPMARVAGKDYPVARQHYWWRTASENAGTLPLTVVSNNRYGILDFTGQWRVRPLLHSDTRGRSAAFSPANAYLSVTDGSGSPDGDGWYGPFGTDRLLRLGFREGGIYTYELELTGSGHYLDGEAFTLPSLDSTYTVRVLSPNSSRRTDAS